MNNIVLREIVNNCVSNHEGNKLFDVLENAYIEKDSILLNVDNDLALSTSFLNTSIGLFLEQYGLENFRNIVKFKGSKAQFNRISKYIKNFTDAHLS